MYIFVFISIRQFAHHHLSLWSWFLSDTTQCNFVWSSLSVTRCKSVIFSRYPSFLHWWKGLLRYNWNRLKVLLRTYIPNLTVKKLILKILLVFHSFQLHYILFSGVTCSYYWWSWSTTRWRYNSVRWTNENSMEISASSKVSGYKWISFYNFEFGILLTCLTLPH